MNRIDGNLAVSRGFGDFEYKYGGDSDPRKKAVTAFPDVVTRKRDSKDQFLVIACDGIWDCLSSERCVQKLDNKIMRLRSLDDTRSLS